MAQEIVKMKQGMSYSCKEKTIILNVFKYLKKIYPEKRVTEIVRRTAKATGCSEKSIFQFRKEEASVEGFKEPSKTKIRKNININSRFIKYDNNVRQAIRNIIYDLKYKNIIPSLSTILKNVNGDEKLPNFSTMTLRRLLSDMGFYYEKEKNSNKSVLMEKPHDKKENLPIDTKNLIQMLSQQLKQNTNIQDLPSIENKPVNSMPRQNILPPIENKPVNSMSRQNIQPPIENKPVNSMPHQNIPSSNLPNISHQMYIPNHMPNHLPNPSNRVLPMPLPQHENHMMDPIHIQHGMILNHRMPNQLPSHHPPHQHMGFIHHPPPHLHHHNMIVQQ